MITTKLQDLTIHEILLLFPQRLHVEFALHCAKSYKSQDKQELKCIELVEKWLADSKSVTQSELEDAADAAYAANSVAYATDSPAHAAYAANAAYSAHSANAAHSAYSANAAHSAYSAASAANSAAHSVAEEELKLHLIKMIKERHTELELILMEVI